MSFCFILEADFGIRTVEAIVSGEKYVWNRRVRSSSHGSPTADSLLQQTPHRWGYLLTDRVVVAAVVEDVVQSGSGVDKHRYRGQAREEVRPRKQHNQGRQERQEGDLRVSPRGCEWEHHPGGVDSWEWELRNRVVTELHK